ncbi:MAG: glycosyl transferase, partial [Pseudomonadota bacterium]
MLKVVGAETAPAPKPERLPLGRHLVNDGVITPVQLVRALELQARLNAPLGEILISEGWASARDVMSALARQHELYHADLRADPPEPHLVTGVPTAFWLKHRVVPWMRLGRALVIATSRPDKFAEMQAEWPGRAPGLLPVIADEDAILGALARLHR